LKDEIVSRYYYQKGAIISALKSDKEIVRVLALFHNPAEYNQLFKPVPAASTSKSN